MESEYGRHQVLYRGLGALFRDLQADLGIGLKLAISNCRDVDFENLSSTTQPSDH